jgi:hypothetical protein
MDGGAFDPEVLAALILGKSVFQTSSYGRDY